MSEVIEPPRERKISDWSAEADSDDEDDHGGVEALRTAFSPVKQEGEKPSIPASAQPASPSRAQKEESPVVASLASRISGLSTSATPFTPSASSSSPNPTTSSAVPFPSSTTPETPSSPSQPKVKPSNALFGKALAGISASSSTTTPVASGPDVSAGNPSPSTSVPSTSQTLEPSTSESNPLTKTEEKDTKINMAIADDGWGINTASHPDTPDDKTDDTISGLVSNRFEIEVKLADLQADPNSPLYSVKRFEDLPIHPDLMRGIYAVGFTKPSKIQEKALPMLLHNPPRNLIGQSQSGTGKTAAFTLNMLSRIDPALNTPQAICLAPSRELARQIQEVVDRIGQFTSITTFLAVPGGWTRGVRIDKHILIGTPGTLVDMLSRGKNIFDPKQIRVFVLDEADEMVAAQGLGDQTRRIKRMLPSGVQNVLFSATFPEEVQIFAESFAPEANKIFLKPEELSVDAIKQLWLECDGEDSKYEALSALYDCMAIGQSIVFCRKKITADQIAQRLSAEGHIVASLHGEKLTSDRDAILDEFRDGKTKVLITTNVVARGIDIQQVNMVVNYDVPDLGPSGNFKPDVETYLHRIGRTGRFGRKGCSVIFVHNARSREEVEEIQAKLGRKMKKIDAKNPEDLGQLEKALKIAMKGPN